MLLHLLAPPLCWSCRAPAARASALCRACRSALRFLRAAPGATGWAAVAYEGPARDLVKALKFHGAVRVADEMAALLAANAPPGLLTGATSLGAAPPGLLTGATSLGAAPPGAAPPPALVPVPLHPVRSRARGFNQATLIARALAKRTGLPLVDCLRRGGSATPQVGRHRAARLSGPAGQISASASAPPRALVVDDVVTTGATLRACAAALHTAGATEVAAIAFARTAGR